MGLIDVVQLRALMFATFVGGVDVFPSLTAETGTAVNIDGLKKANFFFAKI